MTVKMIEKVRKLDMDHISELLEAIEYYFILENRQSGDVRS